jgi:hypothetical protein
VECQHCSRQCRPRCRERSAYHSSFFSVGPKTSVLPTATRRYHIESRAAAPGAILSESRETANSSTVPGSRATSWPHGTCNPWLSELRCQEYKTMSSIPSSPGPIDIMSHCDGLSRATYRIRNDRAVAASPGLLSRTSGALASRCMVLAVSVATRDYTTSSRRIVATGAATPPTATWQGFAGSSRLSGAGRCDRLSRGALGAVNTGPLCASSSGATRTQHRGALRVRRIDPCRFR